MKKTDNFEIRSLSIYVLEEKQLNKSVFDLCLLKDGNGELFFIRVCDGDGYAAESFGNDVDRARKCFESICEMELSSIHLLDVACDFKKEAMLCE